MNEPADSFRTSKQPDCDKTAEVLEMDSIEDEGPASPQSPINTPTRVFYKNAKANIILFVIRFVAWMETYWVFNFANKWGCAFGDKYRWEITFWLKSLPSVCKLAMVCFMFAGISSDPIVIKNTNWFSFDLTGYAGDSNITKYQSAWGEGRVYINIWGAYLDVGWHDGQKFLFSHDIVPILKQYETAQGRSSITASNYAEIATACSTPTDFSNLVSRYTNPVFQACGYCSDYPTCKDGDRTCSWEAWAAASVKQYTGLSDEDSQLTEVLKVGGLCETALAKYGIDLLAILGASGTFPSFCYEEGKNICSSEGEFLSELQALSKNFTAQNNLVNSALVSCESAKPGVKSMLWGSIIGGIIFDFFTNIPSLNGRASRKNDRGFQKFIGMFLIAPILIALNSNTLAQFLSGCYSPMLEAQTGAIVEQQANGTWGPGFILTITYVVASGSGLFADFMIPVPKHPDIPDDLGFKEAVAYAMETQVEPRVKLDITHGKGHDSESADVEMNAASGDVEMTGTSGDTDGKEYDNQVKSI